MASAKCVLVSRQEQANCSVLPTVTAKGKTYIIDERLRELRNKDDITDVISWAYINSFEEGSELNAWLKKMGWDTATFTAIYVMLSR